MAELGLSALEFGPDPEVTAGNLDMQMIVDRVRRYNLVVANISVDPRLRLLDGDQSEALAKAVRQSCHVARQLGCSLLGLLVEEVGSPGSPGTTTSATTNNATFAGASETILFAL